jgi:hypothetical protein
MTGKTDLLQASTEQNMPHFRTAVVFMASALALSACSISDSLDDLATSDQSDESSSVDSSGGTGDSNGSASFPDAPPRPDTSNLESVAEVQQTARTTLDDLAGEQPYNGDLVALLENIRDASDVTPDSDALAGQANYAGSLAAEDGEGTSLLADLSMDFDFDAGSVEGDLPRVRTQVQDGSIVTADGTGTISGTVSQGELTAEIDGEFRVLDENGALAGTMAGEFRGSNADEVVGSTSLNLTSSEGGGVANFDGGFHATKD